MQSTPLDPANLDRSALACTDFYQFANGGWAKTHPVPPAYSIWGSFAELSENNQANVLTILRNSAASGNPQASADLRKLATYYTSCMDSAGAEKASAQPIAPELGRVAAIRNRAQLESEIARLHSMGLPSVFGFGAHLLEVAVDTELGILKTGKEADVFLLRRGVPGTDRSCLLAAKRYRAAEHRMFQRDSEYLEGRRVRESRVNRAIAARSAAGRAMISTQWASAEFAGRRVAMTKHKPHTITPIPMVTKLAR